MPRSPFSPGQHKMQPTLGSVKPYLQWVGWPYCVPRRHIGTNQSWSTHPPRHKKWQIICWKTGSGSLPCQSLQINHSTAKVWVSSKSFGQFDQILLPIRVQCRVDTRVPNTSRPKLLYNPSFISWKHQKRWLTRLTVTHMVLDNAKDIVGPS